MRVFLWLYLGTIGLLAGVAAGGAVVVFDATGPSDGIEGVANHYSFDLFTWEVRHLPAKWLYKAGELFDERKPRNEDAALRRYFDLASQLRSLEDQPDDPAQRETLERERSGLENRVEEIIEGRVTSLLEDEGLALRPPLFDDLGLVFPPVDFELDTTPRVLAISPRERIELDRSYLLRPGLTPETVAAIEREAESADGRDAFPRGVSSLVVGTGGVATYPSVVSQYDSYEGLVDTVIHEWLHQYLIFFPLGRSYFEGSEARTLNESVANIGGRDLARLYFARYGNLESPEPVTPTPTPPPSAGATFDFNTEMRSLRRQVEALLEDGKIAEAEALMETKRQEFAQHGVNIRRLNQAYFAFHGSYADTPASIDPIGPKLEELLKRAGSPGQFVRLAAGITSRAELDRVLAETGA